MDSSAHPCVAKPFLPASLTPESLEDSRARLLRPITPSASWQALLKSPDIQGQPLPGGQAKPFLSSFLDCRCPGGIAPDAGDGDKKPPSFSGPSTFWLENPLLQPTSSAPFTFRGLEETRARLLRPLATPAPQLASLDKQSHFLLDLPENLGRPVSGSVPSPGPSAQNENLEPRQLGWDEDGDLADVMPEYDLTLPQDGLKEPPEEEDGSGEAMSVESEEQGVKEEKLKLVSLVCSSLVEGANFGSPAGELQEALEKVCRNLAEREPEFILKVALYTRRELNIRSTANFLLALSSRLLPCRPYLRRYFCHTVRLPSDWLEVAQLHQSLAGEGEALAPLPSCLRAAMTDKFKQFDAYQLAKYNTRKSRGKKPHRRKTKKRDPGAPQRSDWKNHVVASFKPLVGQLEALEKIFQSEPESRDQHPATPKSLFSLKALIQRLHICEPAQHVMSVLGRRYPSDLHAFSRSRLPGPWDSSLAGTRMKLPTPLTWERELSQRGNTAVVWEGLIDSGKLPFMATLRNLRNILRSGVSERHHAVLLKRLEDKESVIHSRQLPFRFLAAYKVILQLEKVLDEEDKPLPSNACLIKKILKRFASRLPRSREIRSRRVLRGAMEVPIVFQLVKAEKKRLLKARNLRYSRPTLRRYRQALETAIQIAVRHNVPPICGRTLILISCCPNMCQPFLKAQDLCCPNPEQQDGSEDIGKPLTKLDVAMLLGCMVYSASERAQLVFCDQAKNPGRPVPLTGSVLKDVQTLQALEKPWDPNKNIGFRDVVLDLLTRRQRVDTILLLSAYPPTGSPDLGSYLYRHHVAPDFLFVNLCTDGTWGKMLGPRSLVIKCGFSEQVLRFMAESGSSRLLEHVGMVDELHGLPKPQRAVMTRQEAETGPLLLAPKSRWRSVRVFISSTFRDMHGERDLLLRSVFPELRARAARFCLAIEDIDLRWGITEHEAQRNKQLELCLSEVSRSHLFVGILGERYGHIPKEYYLPDEPQYEWVKSYPAGRSVTELEAIQFLRGSNDFTARSRAFFYLREPDFLDSVPEVWKADFAAESEEVKRRLADLKGQLRELKGLASLSRYACRWGGVARGRPFVKGLEDFGASVLQDLWEALQQQFIEGEGRVLSEGSEEQGEDVLQESFQELQQRRFCARAKLLRATAAQLQGGRLCVVSGETGQGKTVFVAALAQELKVKAPLPGDPVPRHRVVAHFTNARPDQAEAKVVLSRLCALLRKLRKEPPAPPRSYRGLVDQFQFLLHSVAQSLKQRQSLVVLIDGADLIHASSGQLVSDWLPEKLPQRVSLILSVSEGSALLGSLKRRKDVIAVPLGPLEPPDRVALIRKDLALYGKKLEESAFNNQMRLVLLKRGSRQPLYLSLLTQDLRLFALYEKLSERIQKLPVSLPLLLQHLLGCLEQDHGLDVVAMALAALWASKEGLTERDLFAVLATREELSGTRITVEEAIVAQRHAGSYPMAPFCDFLRSLRGLLGACGSPSGHPGSRLHLQGSPLRTAVEQRYLKKSDLGCTAHKLLAAHWWTLADPDGSGSFQNCKAESLTALPYHLVQSGCFTILASFLTDLRAVSAHSHLGLLHCLSEAYALYGAAAGLERDETERVGSFRDFLQRNLGLLSQNPSLLLQQASNEPDSSALCLQAQSVQHGKKRPFLKWVNKPQKAQTVDSLVLTLPATPSCVSVTPSGRLAAVGTTDGTLHLLDVETGQELKSLLSACDGISACAFLSETTVCLGAFNGRLELWSLREGCRVMGADAHKARITDCCVSSDCKLLATVSLDGCLKLWDSAEGDLARNRDCSCPLNCVTFHPEGQLVATGGWDKTVTVLNASHMEVASALKGHDSSIRSISFSPAGNVLAAGSLAGSVRLWSWREAVTLGTFTAHFGYVSATQFLPGGLLLTGGEDSKVQLWKGHVGRSQGTLQSAALSPALCLAPNPDSNRLAVGHHSDDVWVYSHPWGSESGLTHCEGNGVAVCSLAWLDSLLLVGGSNDGSLCLWNPLGRSATCLHRLRGHDGAVTGLAVSKDLVASTSEDFTVKLWLPDVLRQGPAPDSSLSPLVVLRGHTAGVTCCAFSLDGRFLATGGKDRALFLWGVGDPSQKTPCLLRSLPFCHQDWISSCAWAGSTLLSGSNDCTVSLWDPHTGKRFQEFLGHQSPICGVTSEKTHVMSVDRDGMLVAWDLQGVEKTRFLAHPGRANHCVVFSDMHKGLLLAAAGSDGTVKLWKPSLMEQPQVLLGHCAAIHGAAASPVSSSSFLTVSEDNTVRLWAAPKVEGVALAPHQGTVTALAWSPDGEFAVSGGETGDLIVWHAAKPVGTAKVGPCSISALAFTLSRTILVVCDSVTLWDINTGKECDGAVSLTQRKHLHKEKKNFVVCVGMSRPCGPAVLGLADGNFLVLQAGAESLKKDSCSGLRWYPGIHASFDISVSEDGILHVWSFTDAVAVFKMEVTSSGKLEEAGQSTSLHWVPRKPSDYITVAQLVKDELLFCADSDGALWTRTVPHQDAGTEEPDEAESAANWQRRKIHGAKITALHILGDRIVTASHDRDVKIWQRDPLKLLGQFRCQAPVSSAQPRLQADASLHLVVGDTLGNVYFLEWSCLCA